MDVAFSARGRLERCELWGNADGGVVVRGGGDPTLIACTVRDHVAGKATGVYVSSSAAGRVTVGADCVFARNAGGRIVRQTAYEAAAAAATAEAAAAAEAEGAAEEEEEG